MTKYFLLITILWFYYPSKSQQNNTIKLYSDLQTNSRSEVSKTSELVDSTYYSYLNIIINDNPNFRYSSIDSICWKKYLNGNKTVKFGLTYEEKKLIFDTAMKIDFFNLPNKIMESEDTCISPSFSKEIIINIKDRSHKVYYSGDCNIKDIQIKKRFREIDNLIFSIIMKKKEVESLPESDINYF